MNISEIICKRRSVRTYNDEPLRNGDRKLISDFASRIENPYGMAIEFRILNADEHGLSSPVIVGASTYIVGKMLKALHAEEAFGYSFEKIVLYAAYIGIGTVWIAGTMDRKSFEEAVELKDGEVMPCVSPLGYPAKRSSVREMVMREGIKADSRLEFEELFFDKNFDTSLTAAKALDLYEALEAVRRAPSAVNRQPWRIVVDADAKVVHFYEKKNKGMCSTDWDIQKIDMGIALCHFEAVLESQNRKPVFAIQDPQIICPEDTEYIASYIVE